MKEAEWVRELGGGWKGRGGGLESRNEEEERVEGERRNGDDTNAAMVGI